MGAKRERERPVWAVEAGMLEALEPFMLVLPLQLKRDVKWFLHGIEMGLTY